MLAIVNFVLGIWNALFRGLIIKLFWGWFILTLFPTLPHLSVLSAVGLSLMVSVLTPVKTFTEKELEELKETKNTPLTGVWNGVIFTFVMAVTLLVGFVFHLFM